MQVKFTWNVVNQWSSWSYEALWRSTGAYFRALSLKNSFFWGYFAFLTLENCDLRCLSFRSIRFSWNVVDEGSSWSNEAFSRSTGAYFKALNLKNIDFMHLSSVNCYLHCLSFMRVKFTWNVVDQWSTWSYEAFWRPIEALIKDFSLKTAAFQII